VPVDRRCRRFDPGTGPHSVAAIDAAGTRRGLPKEDTMQIRFRDTRPADAPAAILFEVITDYAAYPRFNSAVTDVRVVHKDDTGAEFVAVRTTRIAKQVRAYDRYDHHRDLTVERTYAGNATARSTWTIRPVGHDRCTLTIDAAQDLPWPVGLVMKPLLRRLFYGINFTPFIAEAERRARAAGVQPRPPATRASAPR
jgi:ribosome-associated toxin RatA of RatAB toxin-antitoxin module